MRSILALCPMFATGCLLPSNEIRGEWNVGGDGGCIAGEQVSVSVPQDDYWDGYTHYTCNDREFAIKVSGDLQEFSVVLTVSPLVGSGVRVGATVELFRVVDDFNIGLVHFVENMY